MRLGRLTHALGAAALAGFVGLVSYGLAKQGADTTIDDALAEGERAEAPELRLPPLAGGGGRAWDRAAADGTVDIGELRRTPVVINFWASWCDPCKKEAPVLREGWTRAREKGALVVGLNQQDGRSEARRFIARERLDFPHVRDEGRDTADDWGVSGLPETFFLSARGAVVGHVVGAISRSQFDEGLAAATSDTPMRPQLGGEQGGVR